jgi:hypothetical protein
MMQYLWQQWHAAWQGSLNWTIKWDHTTFPAYDEHNNNKIGHNNDGCQKHKNKSSMPPYTSVASSTLSRSQSIDPFYQVLWQII